MISKIYSSKNVGNNLSIHEFSMNNDDMKWNKENEKQFRHESFEHRSAAFDIGPMATIKIDFTLHV